MENIEYVCFTSPCGGTGCTSSAVAFARIASKIYRKKVLVISFDVMTEKMIPVSATRPAGKLSTGLFFDPKGRELCFTMPALADDFSVSYLYDRSYINPLHSISEEELKVFLEYVSRSMLYDLAVLDIPYKSLFSEKLFMCCEKTVIVGGYLETQRYYLGSFEERIRQISERLEAKPGVYIFNPMEDPESFSRGDVDIHDQFGAEVRELAEELFGS